LELRAPAFSERRESMERQVDDRILERVAPISRAGISPTYTIGERHWLLTLSLTISLAAVTVLYAIIHKAITFAPALAGACRGLLFLTAASTGQDGITGLAVWSALALGCYVTGFSFFSRLDRMLRRPEKWPCLLLVAPIALAYVVNQGSYRQESLLLSLVLALWCVRGLRPTLWSPQQNLPFTVGALQAGIALVDLLAVCGAPKLLGLVFLLLLGATLLIQRLKPTA
jgi:hypothetical protein